MFKNLFKTNEEFFSGFHEISKDIYKSIRCIILHQSKTTNAWRVLRKDKHIDKTKFSINADLFLKSLDKSVNKYLGELTHSDFNSKIW